MIFFLNSFLYGGANNPCVPSPGWAGSERIRIQLFYRSYMFKTREEVKQIRKLRFSFSLQFPLSENVYFARVPARIPSTAAYLAGKSTLGLLLLLRSRFSRESLSFLLVLAKIRFHLAVSPSVLWLFVCSVFDFEFLKSVLRRILLVVAGESFCWWSGCVFCLEFGYCFRWDLWILLSHSSRLDSLSFFFWYEFPVMGINRELI